MISGSTLAMTTTELAELQRILKRFVPDYKVWAFGSRVIGTHKPYSDLDIALVGDEPISIETRAALTEALSESALPYKVDIVDWASTSEAFQHIIDKQKLVIQL
ncbi:nucleotidyltransferase domain-containing protein [Zwartia sp.]|uniref:nucleotidyltransferase family protein n=1 Tax=Zwartia sp. TaxID=2978004 RepID=UPI002729129F|nr:nucleotidyltransferase domain-containing protein [Zwartia sp.]MDO9023568.1 nucleotidyltransferase domain-containing protein [Zwartia sp.]